MQCPPWPLSVDRLEAGPKRQAGPNALVCRAAHSKMQLSYSAWNHMEGLKLQVGGWLDSNTRVRLSYCSNKQCGERTKRKRKHSVDDPNPLWPPNLSSHSLLQHLGSSRCRLDGQKTQARAPAACSLILSQNRS